MNAPLNYFLPKSGWSPGTQEDYKNGCNDFAKFCRDEGVSSFPASSETIVKFLQARESYSIAALTQRLAVIRALHADTKQQLPKGAPDRDHYSLDGPIIANAWGEIKRRKKIEPLAKAAVRSQELETILRQVPPDTLKGTKDRAMLCVGLAYALRRTEIVALDRDDLELNDDGMRVRIRGSKSVTLTAARTGTETCPVTAMERWLEAGKITQGAVFGSNRGNRMDGRYAATILQEYGAKAGFDPEVLGAQSLRNGYIKERIDAGENPRTLMQFARIEPARYVEYLDAEVARPNATSSEEKDIAEIRADQSLSETQKKRLIDARLGQGKFRDDLRKRWDDACAVTGLRVLEVLKASHIHPWKHSTNDERLDPANGLLLEANLDSLFDKYLISFQDDGQMIIVTNIKDDERRLLRLPGRLRKSLNSDEKCYLAKHRAAGGFSEP